MGIDKLIKIIFICGGLFSILQANDLNELRTLLGDESSIKKEKIIEKQGAQSQNIDKEKIEELDSKVQYNKLLDAPQEYYTINITTISGIDSAREYLKNNNLTEEDFFIYSFGKELKSVKIIYGIFKSVDDAKDMISKLPPSVLKNRPFIDNIKKHQELFLKYN